MEGELKKLGMISTTQHVSDLCEIISTDQIPSENPQKDYAAIYLKNYLHLTLAPLNKSFNDSSKIQAGSQTILYEELALCAETLIKLIMNCALTEPRR